ncbi:acylphosphatase [Candidatus Peregrinibacteria bacterium]|nr:acylphosphatase [Candidatus Peregrinibacteria bacterium]
MPAQRIMITGKVQGVFFRAYVQEHALPLRITGWVRNCPDGSVEIHAEGTSESLQQLEHLCIRGPRAARVDKIDVQEASGEGCTGFTIL